jgi:transmembrane sensor
MSSFGGNTDALSSAAHIEQRAAEWIERRDFGRWTKTDDTALDAWLEESVDHKVAFYRLDFGWQRTARLTALKPATQQTENAQIRAPRIDVAKILMAVFAVALLCAGSAYEWLGQPRVQTYATGIGGHRIVKLEDGSLVELNTNTIVEIAANADKRAVWLTKGEAFFEVKHDVVRPFTVTVGAHRITDLGTKFLVHRQADRVAVSVVEGRARLETDAIGVKVRAVELAPGDIGLATASTLSVSHKAAAALVSELGWRRGVLIFHDTALAEAAAEFNRYNEQKLVIADSAIARLTVDGTFPSNRIAVFARVARDVLGLRVEEHSNEIVISR